MSPHRPTVSVLVLLVFAAIASGCASLPKPALIGEPTTQRYVGQLLPSGCEPAYQGRAALVADVVCGRKGFGGDDLAGLYAATDVLYPEPFDVAVLLIACVETGQCDGERMNPTRLADFHHYALTVDPQAVARTLTALPLDPEIRKVFYQRFAACRTRILDQVAAMPPRWAAIYLEPLEAARARILALAVASHAQEATLAELGKRVDGVLMAKKADPVLRGELESLRRSHAKVCMELGHDLASCLAGTPLSRKITRLLIQLEVFEGDHAAAAADLAVLDRVRASGGERGELRRAMAESLARELAAEAELKAARERGVQDATITKVRGGEVLVTDDISNLVGDAGAGGGYGSEGDFGIDQRKLDDLEAQVAGVARRGNLADISFRKEMQENSEGYGCYETNKVVQISDSGSLIYETKCAGYKSWWENRGAAHVIVPWAEAQRLRAGMIAYVRIDQDSRKGHVIGLRPAEDKPFDHRSGGTDIDKYVELRGIARVAPPATPPAIARAMSDELAAERVGDWAAAGAALEKVWARQPYPPLLLGIARAHEHQGDLAGAVEAYQRYLASGDEVAQADAARTAIDALQGRLDSKAPAAAPPLPALRPWSLVAGMAGGGGVSETSGGVGGIRLYSGIALLRDHLEGDLHFDRTGGDLSGQFGLDARGYLLTGLLRPYALASVGIGIYESNTSRPVRIAELGGGLAITRAVGRRLDLGVNAELSKSWISIGADPVFPQIMATSDQITQVRIGVVAHWRTNRK